MKSIKISKKPILLFLILCIGSAHVILAAEDKKPKKELVVTYPNVSLSPGEKIVSADIKFSSGKIVTISTARGWQHHYIGKPPDYTLHCYSPHISFHIYNTSMVPTYYVHDISNQTNKDFHVEGSIEIENDSGKRRVQNISESEFIMK